MSTEISTETTGRDLAEQGQQEQGITASQRLALIKEALINPDVAPEKAAAMMELTFKLEDRQARTRFIEAKIEAIAAMPRIGKDGQNTHTKTRYAKWETMQPVITPILARHGLALNFDVADSEDGKVLVTPILSGHGWEERGGTRRLPVDAGKGRNAVQAHISSSSYGKRDAAKAMLNLVESGLVEDDDGNAGGGTPINPYEALTPEEREWVDAGRNAAHDGVNGYMEWFQADKKRAGFLTYNKAGPGMTWHQQNKDAAHLIDNPPD